MFEAYSHSNHEGLIAASCIEKEVRFGSIVLQKSFCTGGQNFRELQARFSCKDLRDLIASR